MASRPPSNKRSLSLASSSPTRTPQRRASLPKSSKMSLRRKQKSSPSRLLTTVIPAMTVLALAFSAVYIVTELTADHSINASMRGSRRLSVALKGGKCQITPAVAPRAVDPGPETSFVASYPGSGAKMSWNLIEALSGIVTGDEHKLNGHKWDRTVTVKTHYPHAHGNPEIGTTNNLDFPHGILLLRNPRDAIPSFYNFLWEWENKLPGHSTRAPKDRWIMWRDNNFEEQMQVWVDHADYWLGRYAAEDRLVITFEDLTDEEKGPRVAKKLAAFLDTQERVQCIEKKSIPCVWGEIVQRKQTTNAAAAKMAGDPLNNVDMNASRSTGSTDRPYTYEQWKLMSEHIRKLGKKYQGDKQLMPILRGYKAVADEEAAKLEGEMEAGAASAPVAVAAQPAAPLQPAAAVAAPEPPVSASQAPVAAYAEPAPIVAVAPVEPKVAAALPPPLPAAYATEAAAVPFPKAQVAYAEPAAVPQAPVVAESPIVATERRLDGGVTASAAVPAAPAALSPEKMMAQAQAMMAQAQAMQAAVGVAAPAAPVAGATTAAAPPPQI